MELENAWYNFITENNIATENEVKDRKSVV